MTSKELYLRLLRFVLPFRNVFLVSILATIVHALSSPAVPYLMKPLVDGTFVERDPQIVQWMPFLLVGVFVLRGIIEYISSVSLRWVSNRVVEELRNRMFKRILDLPTTYFDNNPSGQTISKLTYDVTRVMSASTDVLVVLIRDSLTIVSLLSWIVYLNWKLSLIMLLIAPPTMLVIQIISRRLRTLSRGLQNTMGLLTNVIQEGTLGHKVIKIFGGDRYESARFGKVNRKVRQLNMKMAYAGEANAPLVGTFAATALAVVVYFATQESAVGKISAGEFVSLFTAMGLLFTPIRRLTKINEKLQMGLAAAESIFSLIDEQAETDEGSHSVARVRGEVEYRNLSFRYEGSTEPVLQDISLTIRAGEKVAFVGRSGSGKTTLVNLLARFYQVGGGQLFVDGIPLEEMPLKALRENIAYVGQDTVLFNDTVAANIAYGTSNTAEPAAIENAAVQASALEFIEQLPEGFATEIGENGVKLSGGQRQRIAIARALLKNAPILILDEATSALDTQSERMIQQALENLEQDRTSLIIAHRLSTVENADRIVVMQNGRIDEIGTHRELLEAGGVYADLHRLQHDPVFTEQGVN